MSSNVPVIAGTISTGIFAVSTMPMVLKAARTRDLSSYSGGNLLLSNLGNVLYAMYVFSMPMGPAWALYGFNLTVSATMLVYWLHYRTPRPRTKVATANTGADAVRQPPHRPTPARPLQCPHPGGEFR
jgi:hypothetical protein